MWMRACYIAKRSAGEMICQSSVYLVAGKNSIFIFLFLFYHPTEIIRKKKMPIGNLNKSQNALFICVSTGITYRIHRYTWNTWGLQKCFLLSDFFFFLKHIFHSYHFVFTQVIYVLILKCAWWPSIFKCSKTKTSGRE